MTNGYIRVWKPDHPLANRDGYVLEHRKVWFDSHGEVPEGWYIHHINGCKSDNRIENLEAIAADEHARLHMREAGSVTNQYGTWPVAR